MQLQVRNALVSEELSDYSCICVGLGLFSLGFDPDQTWELSSWVSKIVILGLGLYC